MNPKNLFLTATAAFAMPMNVENNNDGRKHHAMAMSNAASVQGALDALLGHGCFCQKVLNGDLNASGEPSDAYDSACRMYANCIRATKKPGMFDSVCSDSNVSSYDTNGFECRNPTAGVSSCEKATCCCTANLLMDIESLLEQGAVNADASCTDNGGSNNGSGPAPDSSRTHSCVFRKSGLSKIERYDPNESACGQNGPVDLNQNRFMHFTHHPDTSQSSSLHSEGDSWTFDGVDVTILRINNIRFLGVNQWDTYAVVMRPSGAASSNKVINVFQHFDSNQGVTTLDGIDRNYIESELIHVSAQSNFYERYHGVVKETGHTVILHGNIVGSMAPNYLPLPTGGMMEIPEDAISSMTAMAELGFYGANLGAGRPPSDALLREGLFYNAYFNGALQGVRSQEIAFRWAHDMGIFNAAHPEVVQAGESKRGLAAILSAAADIHDQVVAIAPTNAIFHTDLVELTNVMNRDLGGVSWTFTEFVLTGFLYNYRAEVMPVIDMVYSNFNSLDCLKMANAKGIQIFMQACGNDEFFLSSLYETAAHKEVEALENYHQRFYVNDNHFALNELAGGNQGYMATFVGRFAANHFAGHSWPKVNQETVCENDNSCKVVLSYSAASTYHYPVHFPESNNNQLPELWTANSAVSQYGPGIGFPQQLPNGRDFRFLSAVGYTAVQRGDMSMMQDVAHSPIELSPMNASMNVVRGNIVWEYEIPTPENWSSTIMRVPFACPYDAGKLCEAGGSPVIFPRTIPFGDMKCYELSEDVCKNDKYMIR